MLLIRSQMLYLSKIRNGEGYERVADQRWEWRRLGFEENEELTRSDEEKTKDRKLGRCWELARKESQRGQSDVKPKKPATESCRVL